MKKKDKGITLIALMITIILLLILAGVVLNLTLENKGIFNIAKQAGKNYLDAQDRELNELDKLYSSIKVADGSTVTITMEELDKYIEEKVNEKTFTGTELLNEPVVVPTTTAEVTLNRDVELLDSVENYKFILFTFGIKLSAEPSSEKTGIQTLLLPVNQIDYVEENSSEILLNEASALNYSTAGICFRNEKTFRILIVSSSNSGRKHFTIESIQGIK